MINIKKFIKDLKNTRNRFYTIYKYKVMFTILLGIIGFIFALIGYIKNQNSLYEAMLKSFKIFSLDLPESYNDFNLFIFIALIFVILTIFSAVIFTFFKNFVNDKIAKRIIKNEHIALFGLTDANKAFLNSLSVNDNAVVFEIDNENESIQEYQEKGFGVITDNIFTNDFFKILNYETMKYAIIAIGDDKINIEFCTKLIKQIQKEKTTTPTRLIVHITNNELKEIFHQNFVLPANNKEIKIDVKTFSYYEEAVSELLDKHSIISDEIIKTDKSFKSVVFGDSKLAITLIKNILLTSNFPNKNQHTIYLIDKDAKKFLEEIKFYTNYDNSKFPSINFEIIEYDYKTLKLYKNDIFKDNDLENIYVCYEKDSINLNIAISLNEKIYLKNRDLKTKIFFAISDELSLSNMISEDKNLYKRLYSFGSKATVFSKNKLVDEENYDIAKMIHYGYGDEFDKNKLISNKNLNKKWFDTTTYNDKLSNIAQTKHLNIKLQALGLKKIKSDISKEELLQKNRNIFDEVIEDDMKQVNMDYQKLEKYSKELTKAYSGEDFEILYMPKREDNLFEKLIFCEHQRWNSYHFLNDWEYNEVKNKPSKLHNCLKPLNDFKEKNLQLTIIYDIYSIVYIPNYLANSGYEILK